MLGKANWWLSVPIGLLVLLSLIALAVAGIRWDARKHWWSNALRGRWRRQPRAQAYVRPRSDRRPRR